MAYQCKPCQLNTAHSSSGFVRPDCSLLVFRYGGSQATWWASGLREQHACVVLYYTIVSKLLFHIFVISPPLLFSLSLGVRSVFSSRAALVAVFFCPWAIFDKSSFAYRAPFPPSSASPSPPSGPNRVSCLICLFSFRLNHYSKFIFFDISLYNIVLWSIPNVTGALY